MADYWKGRSEALARIARDYGVTLVNYSMGYDLRTVRALWRTLNCKGPQPSDDAFRNFVTMSNAVPARLNEIPNLLFAQAAAYPEGPLDEIRRRDFSADCQRLPQRLRVGYLNLKNNALDEAEARRLSLLSPTMSHCLRPLLPTKSF